MTKVKLPLLSFQASRKLGDDIVFRRKGRHTIAETHPEPQDAKSPGQLSWRDMFLKVVALWHALSAAEKEAWESLARPRHMTGYAWFVSQALRPNPGIYLPLQGGIMQGIIDMDGYAIQDLLDPVNPQDADTEAARDAAIADALEDCIDSHIHGWDGSDWYKLRIESSTSPNLKVKIYDGGLGADILRMSDGLTTHAGLVVKAQLMGALGANSYQRVYMHVPSSDAKGVAQYALMVNSYLMGFNGASWDRLRSYGTGTLKVGRAEIGLSTPRLVAAGQVKAAAGNLYWITMNPSAGLSVLELSDDLDGLGAVVYDHFHTTRETHHVILDPPMEFTTGIWLKTFTNMTSIIFGYK